MFSRQFTLIPLSRILILYSDPIQYTRYTLLIQYYSHRHRYIIEIAHVEFSLFFC